MLAYDGTEPLLHPNGKAVTRWDGRTTKMHPVTGEQVPDESAQVPVLRYLNPRKAEWPEADFVVGNPPFLGASTMRRSLGDGYVDALRRVWAEVPDSADFVMYWWQQAADLTRRGKLRRFGFITTNSLRQTFNRRVLQQHLRGVPPLSLAFAIPDHPWVDSADGAAVRIAMTVGQLASEDAEGILSTVTAERTGSGEGMTVELTTRRGVLHADLSAGANVAGALPLMSNGGLAHRGMQIIGSGFIVTPAEADALGLGWVPGLEQHIRPYRNGRDLTATPRDVLVIDLFGLNADEVLSNYPEVYQWVSERVKPERDQNNRASYRDKWWVFGEPRKDLRPALSGLPRYIATVETAKHRTFVFLERSILPDNKLVVIASDDAFVLGVLSSRVHVAWSQAAGSWLGVGNDSVYVKTRCFETFPFPKCGDAGKARIRELAESLEVHRKRQQSQHPDLSLTDMYNVLEKLRRGETLTGREKKIHEEGLVSVLRQLHDELDAAVFAAYGLPVTLSEEEVLERLVELNRLRARDEEHGVVHWLRPEYQMPQGVEVAVRTGLETGEEDQAHVFTHKAKLPWPKTLPHQVQAVRSVLLAAVEPRTAEAVARTFLRARTDKVGELLVTLAALGQAREVESGCYSTLQVH